MPGQFLSTLGLDFRMKVLRLGDNCLAKLQFWDTNSQERFHRINTSYFKGANFVFLIFDLSNRKTFDYLPQCMEFANYLKPECSHLQYVLIGNKNDKKERQVTREEAEQFALNDLDGAMYVESNNLTLTGPTILAWYMVMSRMVQHGVKSND